MLERFKTVLQQVLNSQNENIPITLGTNLFSDLGLQSLSIISLVALCETEFEVELASKINSIDDISKVADFIRLIQSSKGQ